MTRQPSVSVACLGPKAGPVQSDRRERLRRYMRTLGPIRGRWLYWRELLGHRQTIPVRVGSERLWLRLNSTDILVLYTVFERRDYEMAPSFKPSIIIDAGAYVGYSSVYFAQKYQQARIIALEPVRPNFDLLVRNTSAHPRIVAKNQALWSSVTSATMSDQQQGFWAFAIIEPVASDARAIAGVRTTTIDEILREFSIQWIDLLKLDIEGAEKEVLEHSGTWINRVGVIAAELHDRFKPGCSAALEAATGDFRFARKNDMTVFRSQTETV